MKKILLIVLAAVLVINPVYAERQTKMKDLRPLHFPSNLKTLNISASSDVSYTDAMNRLAKMQPEGYVIETLRYVTSGGKFIVLAKLRKVS